MNQETVKDSSYKIYNLQNKKNVVHLNENKSSREL